MHFFFLEKCYHFIKTLFRFVVRIDNWPSDSQYPNGHLVRILGPIGDLETEISALLTENEISTSSFTPAQVN